MSVIHVRYYHHIAEWDPKTRVARFELFNPLGLDEQQIAHITTTLLGRLNAELHGQIWPVEHRGQLLPTRPRS
jgi:hypothetical protein